MRTSNTRRLLACLGPALSVTAVSCNAQPAVRTDSAVATCEVMRVVDGDTIRCRDGRRVRLLLIDAPERNQGPYARTARSALLLLLPPGSKAQLEFDVQRRDRFGRDLAYVYAADGRFVNEEMVRGGYAVVLVYPPNVKYVERMRAASADAQENRRGLWATPAFDCTPVARRQRRC